MSTDEIKSILHEGIENINDRDFLNTIKELIDRKYNPPEKTSLSEKQIERIKESENQINSGDFLTDSQVNKIIDRWLKE